VTHKVSESSALVGARTLNNVTESFGPGFPGLGEALDLGPFLGVELTYLRRQQNSYVWVQKHRSQRIDDRVLSHMS
jgi:hypothetical protein